ncbi:MAG: tetratricopeptide repeat protein, partial [Acidobacteriota bacterium]
TFLFIALCPIAGATGKDRLKLARSKTAKGERLVKQTEFAGAEKQFRSAISVDPTLPTAYLGLGKALVGQQRYAEALIVLEEAEQRYVTWEQEIQIGDMLKRQVAERQLLSIQDLTAALSDRSGSTGSTPPMGPAGPRQMTPDKIETEQFIFRERWNLESFRAIPSQVFYLEGIAYLRTHRRSLGIEALTVCLLVNPDHHLAHYNLAVALFTRGDFDQAKTHLDTALAGGVEANSRFVADLELALSSRQIAQGSG